jgi:capsular exopolysaccharide synthesis family protein
MSRVDEALKRAAVVSGPPEEDEPVLQPETGSCSEPASGSPLPLQESFAAAWTFDAAERRRPGSNGHPKPEAPLVAAAGPAALFRGFDPAVSERLVVGDHDSNWSVMGVSTEQYRKLAATLHHAQGERDIRAVMITSAVAGEGKTLTAANLALTLSESYRRRVLLVDADLRRPGLQHVFQVPAVAWGLSDALKEDTQPSLMEISANLFLLPAGRPDPDPMSLLTSERMRRIIEEGSGRFDWVIIDAPPVGLLTDASLLAKMVHGTLIVAQAGRTDYALVRKAVDAIGRDQVLGVVLNRVKPSDRAYGYRYDKYYAKYSHR